ncbi:MAG: hypothetical protein KGL67_01905 [Patescibacteria group bacterium]|nr:hypothetical protein [Patescibacteria group bacterium]
MSYSGLVKTLATILVLFVVVAGGYLFWENSKLNKGLNNQALDKNTLPSPEISKLPLDTQDKNIKNPTEIGSNTTVVQKNTTTKSTTQAKDFYKVPENPDIKTLTGDQGITEKPYYNIKFLGFNSAVIIDSFGNTQEMVADSFLGTVDGISVNGMGQDGASVTFSSENTYKFEFYPKDYSFITIKYGFGNRAGNLMTIHYENNYKPWDGVIKFETNSKGVVAATYTKENGGKPTIITPFAAVYGKMAADETGPDVKIVGKDQGDGNVLITITATDPSGIHDIYYYLDEKVGPPLSYTGPFTINKSKITTDLRASAVDLVGNLGWSDFFDIKNLRSF